MGWKIHNGKLEVNGVAIGLPGPAREAVELDGVIVVLLEFFPRLPDVGDRTVVGIDATNAVEKWRIAAEIRPEGRPNQVTGLWVKDGRVWVYFREGVDGYLDLKTGKVIISPGQRPW
jgi:hypothetical protein